MARTSIYMPDDLWAKLKLFHAQINVSHVCVAALSAEVDRLIALHAELHAALEGHPDDTSTTFSATPGSQTPPFRSQMGPETVLRSEV